MLKLSCTYKTVSKYFLSVKWTLLPESKRTWLDLGEKCDIYYFILCIWHLSEKPLFFIGPPVFYGRYCICLQSKYFTYLHPNFRELENDGANQKTSSSPGFQQKMNKTNKTKHARNQTETKQHSCSMCNKSFSKTSDIKRHVMTHTGEKPYTCSSCFKSFNQSYDLKRHNVTHTREKPYICSLCTKSFSHSSSLIYHMRSHTGEKPYICSLCSKSFFSLKSLKSHLRIHTGE